MHSGGDVQCCTMPPEPPATVRCPIHAPFSAAGFNASQTTTDIGVMVALYSLMVGLALLLFFWRLRRQSSGGEGRGWLRWLRRRRASARRLPAATSAVELLPTGSGVVPAPGAGKAHAQQD